MLPADTPLVIAVMTDGDIGEYVAVADQPLCCANESGLAYRAVQCAGPDASARWRFGETYRAPAAPGRYSLTPCWFPFGACESRVGTSGTLIVRPPSHDLQ